METEAVNHDLARRILVGLAGTSLQPAESAWLMRYSPAGVILFAQI